MIFFGAPNIEKLKTNGNISALIRALNYRKDPAICQAAAFALGELRGLRALNALIDAMNGENEHVRVAAATALVHIGHLEATEALFTALTKSETASIRSAAAVGLGHLGSDRAIKSLLLVLYQRDREIYSEAVRSLTQIGKNLGPARQQAQIVEPLGDILEQARAEWRDPGCETLEWLGWEHDTCYIGLTDEARIQEGRALRRTILEALEEMGWQPDESHIAADYWAMKGQWERCVQLGKAAVDPLIATFKHDEVEREHAYLALVEIGAPAAEKLLEALKDDIEEMNQPLFDALVKMGEAALPEIAVALNGDNERIRRLAARSLGKIGSRDAIIHLIEAYGDADWGVRREAFQAIQSIGTPALSILIAALNHPNNEVRRGVAYTLDTVGWQPEADTAGASYCLARDKWQECIAIGAPAVQPLLTYLAHWDSAMAEKAVEALAQIGVPAVEPLINGFARWGDEVSQRAAEVLKLIGTPALGPLVTALKCNYAIVRRRAVEALALIGDPRTEQFLQFVVDYDEDDEVSEAALVAVKAIQKKTHGRTRNFPPERVPQAPPPSSADSSSLPPATAPPAAGPPAQITQMRPHPPLRRLGALDTTTLLN
jgi:HEAT repeat protein